MASNTYITALKESLEKKIDVLKQIQLKNDEQLKIAKTIPFSYELFDRNAEEKGVLIYKLTKLDEGFELVYENVKKELNLNKEQYKEDIKTMQALIRQVTDLSTNIQAEETRNKAAMENAFRTEREKIKSGRSGVKAVRSYSQTMSSGIGGGYSGLMDTKK